MQIGRLRIFRLSAGLAAMAAVLALVLALGTFGSSERASAAHDPHTFTKKLTNGNAAVMSGINLIWTESLESAEVTAEVGPPAHNPEDC